MNVCVDIVKCNHLNAAALGWLSMFAILPKNINLSNIISLRICALQATLLEILLIF